MGGDGLELEGVEVDVVDDGGGDGLGAELDPGQQRLQPVRLHLAVAVQEHQGVPRGRLNKHTTLNFTFILLWFYFLTCEAITRDLMSPSLFWLRMRCTYK